MIFADFWKLQTNFWLLACHSGPRNRSATDTLNLDNNQLISILPSRRQAVSKFALKTKLKCDAIFMWWDLTFDPQSQIVLSCAPDWAKDGDIKQMVIHLLFITVYPIFTHFFDTVKIWTCRVTYSILFVLEFQNSARKKHFSNSIQIPKCAHFDFSEKMFPDDFKEIWHILR